MDFLKIRKFRKTQKSKPENDSEAKKVSQPEEPNNGNDNFTEKSVAVDTSSEVDDDDDDFITNEVKRRLKELRRNSFMVLIPEESGAEYDEEEGETSSSEGRDMGSQVEHLYCDFESIYEKYCERMLFFDRMSAQQLNETGPMSPTTPSPRSSSRKLTSSFRCLSLKKIEEPDSETEHLQPVDTPCQDLETAYVAHICLTWEALHSQYTQLNQKISCQPENTTSYNQCAQKYQQFQVLLQRFIENEPFEQGIRVEKYARSRNSLSKLLQVPNVHGAHRDGVEEEESDYRVFAPDMMKLIEASILTFYTFVRVDKKKSGGVRNLFGSHQNHMDKPLQQVQSIAEKKMLKLKELRKKKGLKKKAWPGTHEEIELLFSLIDAKVVSRVLRMDKITKDQLLWCEDKLKKLNLIDGKLRRDPSPILFPC